MAFPLVRQRYDDNRCERVKIELTCISRTPARSCHEDTNSGPTMPVVLQHSCRTNVSYATRVSDPNYEQASLTRCKRTNLKTGCSVVRRCKFCGLSHLYIHTLRTATHGHRGSRWHGSATQAPYALEWVSPFSDCARPQFTSRCLERGLWVHLSVTVQVHGLVGAYSRA